MPATKPSCWGSTFCKLEVLLLNFFARLNMKETFFFKYKQPFYGPDAIHGGCVY